MPPLRRRAARRQARVAAQVPLIRETTFQIIRDIAAPLVDAELLRLDWIEPPEDDDWYASGAVKLIPAKGTAAAVEVIPEFGVVTLLVGPRGAAHEIGVDKTGRWRAELRACLEAVVGGRYREKRSQGRLAREVLTMTFEVPGRRNITVKHVDLTAAEPDEVERWESIASTGTHSARHAPRPPILAWLATSPDDLLDFAPSGCSTEQRS